MTKRLLSILASVTMLVAFAAAQISTNSPSQGGQLVISFDRTTEQTGPITLRVKWTPAGEADVTIPAGQNQVSIPVPGNATSVTITDQTFGTTPVTTPISTGGMPRIELGPRLPARAPAGS